MAPLSAGSTQTPIPATATPAAIPTPSPSPTLVPAATAAPDKPPAKTIAPAATNVAQPTPTPRPARIDRASEPRTQETEHFSSQRQAPRHVFYEQNGLTLEYYWPLDERGNLSADETEVLVYNESEEAIEFTIPKMTFIENGIPLAKSSGIWEKFPSRASWVRSESISIPPSPYQGETLRVLPGEKAKFHWQLEGVTGTTLDQSVVLDLTVVSGDRTEKIRRTIVRDSRRGDTAAATAPDSTQEPRESRQSKRNEGITDAEGTASGVRWSFNSSTWPAAPDCVEPLVLQTPVDMNIVTAALWPGQPRPHYVAHGAFRFEPNVTNDVTVSAPIGSHLVQASRRFEAEGDAEQYLLFFSVPCGFYYRLDHVRVMPSKLAEALKELPPATLGDSRTTFIDPPLWIEQGEVVATSVGASLSNVSLDFGLYDVRTLNDVTPNPAWADLFAGDKPWAQHGVCFFDYLPEEDGEIMRSLPTGKEGRTSDYCN